MTAVDIAVFTHAPLATDRQTDGFAITIDKISFYISVHALCPRNTDPTTYFITYTTVYSAWPRKPFK